ncbi:GH92 family glycosyl hydrolase [Asticcacaulis sp. 201]|uniref:GH92 family glycosyl hydrolase n=1 Tax=Asticcacaulis sp. 201 TaxID=3028787 RepID=UPI0029163080|nr:GH92 family glycosyl hydrolase [Asticcacaulis sp. 201]MDV6331282.1 GH92 family glycosyl hydrolase [Asticcacaulis sp. 201]
MISRRQVLAGTVALGTLPQVGFSAGESVCDHVDPFIGTGGHGHLYPGATLPFGMVQLSPDTSNEGWDSCSGYHQADGSIMGFSHTHLSGTGCPDMLDILLVPATGAVKLTPGSLSDPDAGYRSRYDRKTETATPGYYSVELTDSRVKAELTATTRVGLHRYTFPKGEGGHVLLDLAHGAIKWWGDHDLILDNVSLKLVGNDTVVGGRQVFQWAKGRWIFFALKLSRPFTRADLYSDDQPATGPNLTGKNLKAALHFPDAGDAPLLIKVGISSVDIEGALKNLEAELPDFDFERIRGAARTAWEHELSRVRVEMAGETDRKIFYTAHYHTLLAPTIFQDVDGRYRGMDNAVHTLKAGEANYSTYSLWDTYRSVHPFFTITQQARLPGMIGGLVRMGEQSPDGVPIWPLQGRETDTMIGYHCASVLAEAAAKGIKGVDYKAGYAVLAKRAFVDDVHGLGLYRQLGYIPADKVDESVSRTLEFAYSDWCTSKLAAHVGESQAAKALRARSQNYRNVFDTYIGFMRGKQADGQWVTPYNPHSLGHDQAKWRDFTETNGWQATFLNQHDIYTYANLFGGLKAFEAKLDGLFNEKPNAEEKSLADISGLVGQYAHGNEPSHHVAYLYAYTGAPWKTQSRVRELMKDMYRAQYDGLEGNEDCGAMSAWYLMSALGLYAVDPVTAVYVFGSPLVQRAEIAIGGGRKLIIAAPGNSADNIYVQRVRWNGKPYSKSWIHHADLMRGGELIFEMGPRPNPAFGANMVDRPPSFS